MNIAHLVYDIILVLSSLCRHLVCVLKTKMDPTDTIQEAVKMLMKSEGKEVAYDIVTPPDFFATAKYNVTTMFLWWGGVMKKKEVVRHLLNLLEEKPAFTLDVVLPNPDSKEAMEFVRKTLPDYFQERDGIIPTPERKVNETIAFIKENIINQLCEEAQARVRFFYVSSMPVSVYLIDDFAYVSFYQTKGYVAPDTSMYMIDRLLIKDWLPNIAETESGLPSMIMSEQEIDCFIHLYNDTAGSIILHLDMGIAEAFSRCVTFFMIFAKNGVCEKVKNLTNPLLILRNTLRLRLQLIHTEKKWIDMGLDLINEMLKITSANANILAIAQKFRSA